MLETSIRSTRIISAATTTIAMVESTLAIVGIESSVIMRITADVAIPARVWFVGSPSSPSASVGTGTA